MAAEMAFNYHKKREKKDNTFQLLKKLNNNRLKLIKMITINSV